MSRVEEREARERQRLETLVRQVLDQSNVRLRGCIMNDWSAEALRQEGQAALPAIRAALAAATGREPGYQDLVALFLRLRPDGGEQAEVGAGVGQRCASGQPQRPGRRTLRLGTPADLPPRDPGELHALMAAQAWLEPGDDGFHFILGSAAVRTDLSPEGFAPPWIQIDFERGSALGIHEVLRSWLWLAERTQMTLLTSEGATVTAGSLDAVARWIDERAQAPARGRER